jgi:SNF2 family DNA or RNA helicase
VGCNEEQFISSKVDALIDILIHNAKKGEKTVVFSQFVTMLKIVKEALTERGLDLVEYYGSMNRDEKEINIGLFRSHKVGIALLASLRCMSVGLNLVEANNVVFLDLWWNAAVEVLFPETRTKLSEDYIE